MRIMVDIASLRLGGAERQVVHLVAGLNARGHQVALVVNKRVEAYRDELAASGIVVRELGRMGRYDPRVLPDLAQCVWSLRPEVVVTVSFNATFWGRIAAGASRCACVTAEHSCTRNVPLFMKMSNSLLSGVSRATIACGEAQIPALVAAGNRRDHIVVIRNGVDVDRFATDEEEGAAFRERFDIPGDAVVLGLVAAHRPEKRHDRFISLIENLQSMGHDVWGCMVGGGDLLPQTQRLAADSPVSSRLIVTGPLSQMTSVYSGLDLTVLVSDDVETFPMSLLEAQACGCPVAAMDICAVKETFSQGTSGILVGQGDMEGLAQGIAHLLSSDGALEKMGDAGRIWVRQNRTVDQMVAGYEELLEDVLGGASS
jgi:glycosyltransferase involved in cell wall biosynthesis